MGLGGKIKKKNMENFFLLSSHLALFISFYIFFFILSPNMMMKQKKPLKGVHCEFRSFESLCEFIIEFYPFFISYGRKYISDNYQNENFFFINSILIFIFVSLCSILILFKFRIGKQKDFI